MDDVQAIFFSPSSIVAIFNAATVTREEKKIIQVRGVFKKTGTANYGGFFYNRLKDEASESSMTLITSALIHHQLEDNTTIEFNGYITRRLDKLGRIEININIIDLLDQRVNRFSEEDTKKIGLINQKVEEGFKDLDAFIKQAIFHAKKISIKVIMGRSGIIDTDIKQAMEETIGLYDIEYHRISLSSPEEIILKILMLDVTGTDVICVARGGGDNLAVFDNPDICTGILSRKVIIASAIGHAENISLFEKLSDKKFITPTQFGTYLKNMYNNAVEELQDSKAKLTTDITKQLAANYEKQIQNLNEQVKATKELQVTQQTQLTALHNEKLKNFNQQLENAEKQQKQKDNLLQQSANLVTSLQKQLKDAESKSGIGMVGIIIAIIVGIIIGVALAGKR